MAASLAESANIALVPSLYLKQSGLLDQMRREILCDGGSLVQADSTSASVRGSAIITSSVNLMTQLYTQVDSSTWPLAHTEQQPQKNYFLQSQFVLNLVGAVIAVPVSVPSPLSSPSAYSYAFKSMPDALALDRIAVGEIDFASE